MKLTRKVFVKNPIGIKEEQQVRIFSVLVYLLLATAKPQVEISCFCFIWTRNFDCGSSLQLLIVCCIQRAAFTVNALLCIFSSFTSLQTKIHAEEQLSWQLYSARIKMVLLVFLRIFF